MELGSIWAVVLCVFGALAALQWLLTMNRNEDQTCSAGRSLKQKLKLKPGFQDHARGGKVLAVEDPDKEDLGDPRNLAKGHEGCSSSSITKGSDPAVQSNSNTTSTPFPGAYRDYDVFLSFRGEDTRKNFTDHLYNALVRVGIHTFRDEEELERGRTISIELLSAIHRSKISIVVFSKDYASSSWCLDELVEILHCRKTMGHTLLPIFYHVDPSDVRKQVGSFAEAFVQHEQRFQTKMKKVRRWRAALTEAANCSGWDLQGLANGYESNFIERIVTEVSRIMKRDELKVTRHLVGINSRVERILHLLNLGTNDVRMLGIYGLGGVGKTTLAKAIYNQIRYEFEGSSCLLNIKQNSKQPRGLVHLQKQLLYDILKIKDLKIANVDHGIHLIEERIYRKKILIILDDVDDPNQFYELLGSLKKFGPRSRIIVTTRDDDMLTILGVHDKYKVEELGKEESFWLFNLNAFNTSYPKQEYMKLSIDIVKYCGGLPLALQVLGSSLVGRSISDWKIELKKLQRTPHPKIQEVLRLSFESLDDTTKNIFLDIACFFIGWNKDYVIKVLDGCDLFPINGINTLIWRSLLTIDLENKLRMHNLIQNMGRQIVQEESLNYPERRSRLWFHEDILNVLHNHMGTKTIEGIILNLFAFEDVHIETQAFANMKRLRLLQIKGVHLTGSYENLPKKLRLLSWQKCPLKFLPQNFYLENLVILDMKHSNIEEIWKNNKKLGKLKVLDLKGCRCLKKSPNFSQVPQLEVLILKGCINLVQIHESIGDLKRLVVLDLKRCKKLWSLPSIISNLKSLEVLNLSGCLKLKKLPEDLGNMIALKQLLANGTTIEQLPSSIVLLKNLKTLRFSRHQEQSSESLWSHFLVWMSQRKLNPISLLPTSVFGLHSLKRLNLRGRNLSEDRIPDDLGSLCSLTKLDLSRNNFRILPHSISCLPKLRVLYLLKCPTLRSISRLPASVRHLYARDCTSMERLLISPNRTSLFLDLYNCPKLTEIQGLERKEWTSYFIRDLDRTLASDVWSQILLPSGVDGEFHYLSFTSRPEIPNWFNHQSNGSSIFFHVTSISKVENLRLSVCAIYTAKPILPRLRFSSVIVRNKSRGYKHIYRSSKTIRPEPGGRNEVFLFQTGLINNEFEIQSGDEIEVSIKHSRSIKIQKWGVHVLVVEPKRNEEHETMVTNGESNP